MSVAPLEAEEITQSKLTIAGALMPHLASQIHEANAAALRYVTEDRSPRVPRRPEQRIPRLRPWLNAYFAGPFASWLEAYRSRFVLQVEGQASMLTPILAPYDLRTQYEAIQEYIWPLVETAMRRHAEEYLLRYAIRGIAITWAGDAVADTLLHGFPEYDATTAQWSVPLLYPGTQVPFGAIKLDSDGNVLSDAAALQRQAVDSSPT